MSSFGSGKLRGRFVRMRNAHQREVPGITHILGLYRDFIRILEGMCKGFHLVLRPLWGLLGGRGGGPRRSWEVLGSFNKILVTS